MNTTTRPDYQFYPPRHSKGGCEYADCSWLVALKEHHYKVNHFSVDGKIETILSKGIGASTHLCTTGDRAGWIFYKYPLLPSRPLRTNSNLKDVAGFFAGGSTGQIEATGSRIVLFMSAMLNGYLKILIDLINEHDVEYTPEIINENVQKYTVWLEQQGHRT